MRVASRTIAWTGGAHRHIWMIRDQNLGGERVANLLLLVLAPLRELTAFFPFVVG